jgi:hypothetical protein
VFQRSIVTIPTPPVLEAEVVAAAAEPEEEEEVVLAALGEDEERDDEPDEEVDALPDETAVDPLDEPDVPDPAALETEAELYNDSLLALLEALILLMTSATVLAAVPLAVRGVAEPARQVVTSRPILMPVRPSS